MTVSIAGIPAELNAKLVEEYLEIKKRFAMNDWGPGQLKGGRFAEVVLRVYQHLLGDAVTPFGVDIRPAEKTRILNTIESASAIDAHIRQKRCRWSACYSTSATIETLHTSAGSMPIAWTRCSL